MKKISISCKPSRLALTLFPLLGLVFCLQAKHPKECVVLTDEASEVTDKIQLAFATAPKDLSAISYLENQDYQHVSEDMITKDDGVYIGRITLCNNSDYQYWTFRTQREYLSHFKVIFISEQGVQIKHSGGFEKRSNQDGYFPIQSRYNYVDIRIEGGTEETYYFYFENQRKFASPRIELSIIPKNESFYTSLNSWKARTYLVAGLFSFLIILGLTFYINSKDKSFLFYALYLLSLLIWIFYAAGLYDDFLQSKIFIEHPENARSIGTVIICYVFYITFLWYFGDIFHGTAWGKKYYRYWIAYILIFVPFIVLSNFITQNNIQIFFALGVVFNIGMILISVEAIRRLWKIKDDIEIKNVLIGLGIMLLLVITASYEIITNDFQLPEFSIISVFFIIEIVFFLWALSRRYKTYLVSQTEKQVIAQNLQEKDTLLREIHHRVKNNLQVISALLTLQSKYVDDDVALSALKEGQSRVHSMALIHQDLYQHDNLRGVNAKGYFEKLTNTLIDTYQTEDSNIELRCEIDPIILDVDTMIPLGLIVNELTSNALKHAFHQRDSGLILIELKERDHQLFLKIVDDGSGADVQVLEQKSFGFSLIRSFAKRLDAELVINNDQGLEVILQIKNYQKAA